MAQNSKLEMKGKQLQTAVLGLDERGQLFSETLSKSELFQLAAVADKDTKQAEKTGEKYKCAFYDDYRQLVIQNQFDCLVVSAGLHSCDEYVRTAMKKKINILKLPPLARNFEEAKSFVSLCEEENVVFCVANLLRFSPGFMCFRDYMAKEAPEQIFMISVTCTACNSSYPAWQSDWKLSGGGVVLHDSYEIIDAMLLNFPQPEQIYSSYTNQGKDRQQRLYLTEDTALMAMKFSDSLIGNLTCGKIYGPETVSIKIFAKEKVLLVEAQRMTIYDLSGNIEQEYVYKDELICRAERLLENFASAILTPDKSGVYSTARENMGNMALIESAYLSARTGMPEEPGKL
ncbi:MAG: Gfo/Idh/MocA family oxidoreductase, partial [Candidatus Brocadiia bacterium]